MPTAEEFRALARSSPWLWTTLHFRHRSDYPEEAEAWVRRPGELLVRRPGRDDQYVTGVPYGSTLIRTTSVVTSVPPGSHLPMPEPERAEGPTFRTDGLVATRPPDWHLEHGDPMWGNYTWTAMLDPEELSHHVDITGLRETEVAGRPAWRADLRARLGYLPRCGGNCCDLLYSEAGLRADFADPEDVPVAWRDRTYPDHYDVALDRQTGVVVRCLPVGGPADASWLENDILEVDVDLSSVFDGHRSE